MGPEQNPAPRNSTPALHFERFLTILSPPDRHLGFCLTQLLDEPETISLPVEITATPVKPAAARFLFVDSLRGIAACCVMFFHFVASGSFWQLFQARLPHLFGTARFGYLGVDIF